MAKADTPPPDPTELVQIRNPDLPGDETATTSREAFDLLWKERGFEIVESTTAERDPSTPLTITPDEPAGDTAPATTRRGSGSGSQS